MERLAEVGADGQWGIFSMTIPGRVGYQVSFFFFFSKEKNNIKTFKYINYCIKNNLL